MLEVIVNKADFIVSSEYEALRSSAPHAGAIVFFVGLVRDFYGDELSDKIDYIELQHYPDMTEKLCQQIVDQAKQRWQIDAVRVVHRVGKLTGGEQIVMVATASRHREDAFAASQFIIDYLKTKATLWKKEVGSSGEKWLGIKDKDIAAAGKW